MLDQYDKETGLYYLNARMYDPKTARFLQEDTYLGEANDPLSLNLYTYCHNEPLMYVDPTGNWDVISTLIDGGKEYFEDLGDTVVQAVKHPLKTYISGEKEFLINMTPIGTVNKVKSVYKFDKSSNKKKVKKIGYMTTEVTVNLVIAKIGGKITKVPNGVKKLGKKVKSFDSLVEAKTGKKIKEIALSNKGQYKIPVAGSLRKKIGTSVEGESNQYKSSNYQGAVSK